MTQVLVHPAAVANVIQQNGLMKYKGLVWVGNGTQLRQQLVQQNYSLGLGGHFGVTATMQRIKASFYCPSLLTAVRKVVLECDVYQRCKREHVAYIGLLQPLPLPSRPWEHITMDFIEDLPKSEGKNTIFVIVDRFGKYVHFLSLSHPFILVQVARLFMENIYKMHGLPTSIVSDSDKIFLSLFWKELFKGLRLS